MGNCCQSEQNKFSGTLTTRRSYYYENGDNYTRVRIFTSKNTKCDKYVRHNEYHTCNILAKAKKSYKARFIIYYDVELNDDIKCDYNPTLSKQHIYQIVIVDTVTTSFIVLTAELECVYSAITDPFHKICTEHEINGEIPDIFIPAVKSLKNNTTGTNEGIPSTNPGYNRLE